MFTVESLRELYSHMEWADARVWSVILGTERASNDEVIKKKLVHIHLVQRVFLSTWTKQPWEAPNSQDFPDLAAMWRWANPYYAEVKEFFASVDHAAVAEPLPESFARQIERSLGAGRICPTVAESAMQVASHSTHHRGQLNTRLRELGEEPPQFDYIAWVWFGRPTAEWDEPVAGDAR